MRPPCDEAVIRSVSVQVPCSGGARLWILTATILGSSMAFIDSTVVNVSHAGTKNRGGENPESCSSTTWNLNTHRSDYRFVARWSHGCYRRFACSYLSSARRSHLPSVAAAS